MNLAAVLVAANACGDPRADEAVVRMDSAGVKIVLSGGVDRRLPWTFEERLRLGGTDSGPESFYHVLKETVGVDGRDRIYVLDIIAQRVAVFTADGAHLRTLGSPGRGPGEFGEATGFYVAPDGGVEVYDYRKMGLVRFAPDGTPVREQRFAAFADGRFARHDGTLLVSWVDRQSLQDSIVYRLDAVRERDTTSLAVVARPRRPRVQFTSCNTVPFVLEPVFEPALVWAAKAGRVAVAATVEYRVDVFDGLEYVLSVRRAVPARRASRELAVRHLGRGLPTELPGQDLCFVPPDQVVDQVGFAGWVPPIAHVAIAPDGTFWVSRTTIGQAPEPIDVFAATGEYLGTLPANSPRPLAFSSDGAVLTAELDEFDIERLVVYTVRRQNAP